MSSGSVEGEREGDLKVAANGGGDRAEEEEEEEEKEKEKGR